MILESLESGSGYEIIYADPPWSYFGDPNKDQAAGKHYNLMSLEEICALPVMNIAAKRCALFLWATGPRLHFAMEALLSWGFHFRGVAFVWVKTRKDGTPIGGQGVRPTFTKSMDEFVLVGSTNKTGRTFPLLTEKMHQNVFEPRPDGVHSRKPEEVRRRIVDLLGPRKRIELFARGPSPDGWDSWGNEASK